MHKMRTIEIDDPVAWSVCRHVCHAPAPCKNDWTDRCPVWGENSWGNKGTLYQRRSESSTKREGGFDAAFAKLLWPLVVIDTAVLVSRPLAVLKTTEEQFKLFSVFVSDCRSYKSYVCDTFHTFAILQRALAPALRFKCQQSVLTDHRQKNIYLYRCITGRFPHKDPCFPETV